MKPATRLKPVLAPATAVSAAWLRATAAPALAQDLPLLDWTSFVPQLERLASEKLSREVQIAGVEIVEPSLTPLLRLRGVRVANSTAGCLDQRGLRGYGVDPAARSRRPGCP